MSDSSAPVRCPVIISRERELATIAGVLERLQAGSGGTLFLVGEPGIGKTRLARAAEERARDMRIATLRGRAAPSTAPIPFRPLAEALAPALREGGIAESLAFNRTLLSPLLSEGGSHGVEANRFALFDAVMQLLGSLGAGDGLLLVFEDIHWADGDMIDFIDHFAENLRDRRVACLCTMRDEPSVALERAETLDARRAADVLRLTRLTPGEVAEMTRISLDRKEIPQELEQALTARAEGVPFIVEEMLSAYVASGDVSAAMAIPHTFRDLVRARLDSLDEKTRRVLFAAAVIGRRFEWSLLTAVTGLAREEILEALRLAVRAQLIVTDSARFEMPFAFRHALVREAVVAELLPPERAEISLRAAEAVEDLFQELPGEWCERAAELREAAGDRTAAARHLQEAARRAVVRDALASAESMLDRARALAAGDRWHLIGIDMQLVDVLSAAGKVERLREIGAAALSFVREKRARMPLLSLGLGDLHLRLARGMVTAGDEDASSEHLEYARTFAEESGEKHLAARVQIFEAQRALARGDVSTALKMARQAATVTDLHDVLAEALRVEGRAAFIAGDADRALQTLRRALEVAPSRLHTGALLDLGEIESLVNGSMETLEQARSLASGTGAVSSEAKANLSIGSALVGRFLLEEGAGPLARCLEMSRRYRLALLSEASDAEAQRLALSGDVERAEMLLGEPGATSPLARAVIALLQEEHDEARAVCETRPADPVASALAALLGGDGQANAGAHSLAAALLSCATVSASADPAKRWDECDAQLSSFPWWRHVARRIVAESALHGGWGDPVTRVRESLTFFEAAGHDRLASACKAILRRAGAPVPRKGRGDSAVPPALGARGVTSREMDVLRLIGDGLGNREIAKRLFLSPRTVETHVASLMRKLGASDRAVLAGAAADARAG